MMNTLMKQEFKEIPCSLSDTLILLLLLLLLLTFQQTKNILRGHMGPEVRPTCRGGTYDTKSETCPFNASVFRR